VIDQRLEAWMGAEDFPAAMSRVANDGGRLFDQLVEELGRSIVLGVFPPGEPLSADRIIAEFGVSRSVVREVFRALETKGLIVARPRVGTRVTPQENWNFLDPQVLNWRLLGPERQKQITELFQTRSAIEPMAAKLAATSETDALISTLERAVSMMRTALESRDVHAFTEADILFHTVLLRASGNMMFVRLEGALRAALRARESVFVPLTDRTRRGLDLHDALIASLRSGDASGAESTMRTLLAGAHEEVDDTVRTE
jgi:DNA-binding FadR family transcriptional regulator